MLSEIIQQLVITFTEERTGTLLVLISKIGLGGSTGDAQVVETLVGFMGAVENVIPH